MRLTLLLWHLAGRWGRVEHGGIRLALPLTHRLLGRLVGAERPSVSHALSRLSQAGLVTNRDGALHLQMRGEEVQPGVTVAGASPLREDTDVDGAVWIGRDVQLGANVRLMGPVVLGDGARVGDGAQLRESILFPGTEVAPDSILIGAIAGHGGILQSLRRDS